jgi:peptidoglycan hydrolase-like protein with peptidoglycan-binding domain
MDEGVARARAERQLRRRRPAAESRPDRVALWAVFLGLFATVAAAASAHAASSGGVGDGVAGGTAPTGACPALEFGQRPLKLGDCGTDVQTLNWLLKSKPIGSAVLPDGQFSDPTEQAVKTFQEGAGLGPTGVVDKGTRKALKKSMNKNVASWYGPGFFGNDTACGGPLHRGTIGVAHRTLPCGTRVAFYAHGEWLNTEVIDRGPFVKDVTWDLTEAAAEQLEVTVTEKVRSAVVAG